MLMNIPEQNKFQKQPFFFFFALNLFLYSRKIQETNIFSLLYKKHFTKFQSDHFAIDKGGFAGKMAIFKMHQNFIFLSGSVKATGILS